MNYRGICLVSLSLPVSILLQGSIARNKDSWERARAGGSLHLFCSREAPWEETRLFAKQFQKIWMQACSSMHFEFRDDDGGVGGSKRGEAELDTGEDSGTVWGPSWRPLEGLSEPRSCARSDLAMCGRVRAVFFFPSREVV